ncbi:MAG: [FeFe] hydrogenase H-cluster radical SAM maturase HydE [bacterium]
MCPEQWTGEQVESCLRETDSGNLQDLWTEADRVRRNSVGDEVHLRGLVEISNHCVRNCLYCGLRVHNRNLPRYRMSANEVIAAASQAKGFGYGTVVLQSGEDPGWTSEAVANLIRAIKQATGLAITLSLGERNPEEYRIWREAGADRVLLRFETSDNRLYHRIHPPLQGRTIDRRALLLTLRAQGYEVGSGVMVGIPGQTFSSLAEDILLFRDLDLDMVGLGPFVPNSDTPLGGDNGIASSEDQVPATVLMTLKAFALTRLVRPDANIPSTSAMAALDPVQGHHLALSRGANVIMPNMTPLRYRGSYLIYPGKAYVDVASLDVHASLASTIRELGRKAGVGAGSRFRQRSVN